MNATSKRRTYEFYIQDFYDFNHWVDNLKFEDKKVIYDFTVAGTKPFSTEWQSKLGLWKIKLFVYKNAKFNLQEYVDRISKYDRETYITRLERMYHRVRLNTILEQRHINPWESRDHRDININPSI